MSSASDATKRIRQARGRGWSWNGAREKHFCLASSWIIMLEQYEREIL